VSVFVDTSALYPLLVRTEEGHERVAKAFSGLLADGRALTTSNYVLLETAAVLEHRLGLAPARDLEAGIVPLLRVLWVKGDIHRAAVERLFRADRRELSLVDCSSFQLMDAHGIRDAFALDEDFAREGFRVLPRA
jgi:predicted nucleic acid-binding protein